MRPKKFSLGQRLLTALFAFVLGAFVLFPARSDAVTQGGTEITNTWLSGFYVGNTKLSASSNQTKVTVNNIGRVAINPPQSGYIQAGKSIQITHLVTNNGNAADYISIETQSAVGLTAEFFAADGVTPLVDSNSDGKIDTGLIASGASLYITVKLTAPESLTANTVDTVTTKATSSVSPTATATVVDTLTVLKANYWDPLEKTVSPEGQLTPSSEITYTNTFGNSGNFEATNILITDPLDSNLIYIEGSATEPPGISGTVITYDSTARTISWLIPSIPAGYTGQVSFKARINPDAPSDSSISNTIQMTSDQAVSAQSSTTATITVVEQPLRISKVSNKSAAELGDLVTYTVTVENSSEEMTASDVAVLDSLPKGFRYIKGSTVIDGHKETDPSGETALRWEIGTLEPGASKTVSYSTVISPASPLGNAVNSAMATGKSPGANSLSAGPSRALVKVKEGVLNSKAVILGRVFIDKNDDRMPDDEEEGVKGVRLYLEDGTYAVTDSEGKFSIYGVPSGTHNLKIDPLTIPSGLEPMPLDSSFAGDGGSRFITTPYGGPARGDFAFVRKENEPGKQAGPEEKKKRGGSMVFGAELNPAPPTLEQQITTMSATAEILSPSGGEQLKKTYTDVFVRVPEEVQFELRVNGNPVSQERVGKIIYESEKKIFIYQYVSVTLERGSNRIEFFTGKDQKSLAGSIEVYAPGEPEKILITPPKAEMTADGKTEIPLTIKLVDKWGKPSPQEQTVTIVTEKGAIIENDIDPSVPGHQVRCVDGQVTVHLRSTLKTGDERIKVLLGSRLEGYADIYFTPELRDWIIAGIGELTFGDRDINGNMESITDGKETDEGIYREGRLAFFAKGRILGKYLLTAAYDSEKEKPDELFRQVDPDRYYSIYGDAGEMGYEAESQRKLFVKIEKDKSSVMFGDFKTDISKNEFSRYDRTFNGLKADVNTDMLSFRGFATSTTQTVTKDEFAGNGTSGFYFLSKNPVVENSETVRIEVRDRYHPEQVVSSTDKVRYSDYTIDYVSGSILFKDPVPSVDDSLNPVFIVVVYESDDPGDKHYIYGGRAGIKTERIEAGVTAVREEKDVKDTELYGADLKIKVTDNTVLKAEAARTETFEKGNDTAVKTELESKINDKLGLSLNYRDVGQNFDNPSMSGAETGTRKYGAKAEYRLSPAITIGAEGFVQEDKVNRTTLTSASIGGTEKLGKYTLETGFKRVEEITEGDEPSDKTANLFYAGAGGSLTEKLGVSIRREQAISSDEIEDYVTKTILKMDYKLTEVTKAYLTQEFQEGSEEKKDSTVFGIDSSITKNTVLTSKYQMDNAISGESAQASIGLNNKWEVVKRLLLDTRIERIQALHGSATDNTAFSISAEYTPDKDLKVTGKYELRFAEGEITSLYMLNSVAKLSGRHSLITKFSLWNDHKAAGTDVVLDTLAGIAYRPLGKNSIYTLGIIRYKLDRQGSSDASDRTESLIASMEASYRVRPDLTILGKYAGKYAWEEESSVALEAYTDLLLAGASYDITSKWDIAFYAKLMNQYQTSVHTMGYIVKTDYNIIKNLFVGIGYNSSSLDDRDLAGKDYRSRGVFIDMRFKFDENILRNL